MFTFTYGPDGVLGLDVTGGKVVDGAAAAGGGKATAANSSKHGGGKTGSAKAAGGGGGGGDVVSNVRYQVCRLMRMLVQICQTLDRVPGER